ncbi:MAG TPA: efflux RND transporter permease subunit, partial [bacterium]|nr:efflux RND transporter permease subunit [bacterium]
RAVELPGRVEHAGAEFRQSMAVVTIGGVFISMVFTLFLLPVLYTYLDRITLRGWREHKGQKEQSAT